MVFQSEAQFQQFTHCKFRENIIRLLYIPTIEDGMVFVVIDKFGKIGIYDPENFTLLHTYLLEFTLPMSFNMTSKTLLSISKYQSSYKSRPKCQTTHLVIDGIYASDVKMIIFATTKNILQCYDIGEIEGYKIGLEIFPRKEVLGIKPDQRILKLKNKGHVETHRIFGLNEIPHCLEYFDSSAADDQVDNKKPKITKSKLLIGDIEGNITIITIDDQLKPFGLRKIRGVLHEIKAESLIRSGNLHKYKAHYDIVLDLRFIQERQLIISCSKDEKFSLFVKDFTETADPYIVSLPKGVNTFTHSDKLKVIATGSDDGIVRLFNQFALRMPQMELCGHRWSIIGIEFLSVPFSNNPILMSYSTDVEIRAWDPVNFVCLQSLYISFPLMSNFLCKTPEFAKRALIIHQPHYKNKIQQEEETQNLRSDNDGKNSKIAEESSNFLKDGKDGSIIALYCNSFANLFIEKDTSNWPFDFEDFATELEQKAIGPPRESKSNLEEVKGKMEMMFKNPKVAKLTQKEISEIESKLNEQVQEILQIKRQVDKFNLTRSGLDLDDTGDDFESRKSLTAQVVHKYFTLKDQSTTKGRLMKEYGASFNCIPLQEIKPIEFSYPSERLPVTQLMRKYLKKDKISSISDLLTEDAKMCFSKKNLQDNDFEANVTEKTFPILTPFESKVAEFNQNSTDNIEKLKN